MPKIKSHSGAKKRFKVTGSGKVKFAKANRGHFLTEKSNSRKRKLRKGKKQKVSVLHGHRTKDNRGENYGNIFNGLIFAEWSSAIFIRNVTDG